MMLELKLAYRNIKGAGLRTGLNVAVLALTYVLMTWHQGFFTGMLEQGSRAMIDDEIAGGQYWYESYDPFDALSYDDSHGQLPDRLDALVKEQKAVPILIRQAALYHQGRMQTVLLKGIDPAQKVLRIPTGALEVKEDALPVLIGTRMAKSRNLAVGDYVTIRWRDKHGTFDAVEGKIIRVMSTKVPTIDTNQLWVSLEDLRRMTVLPEEATMVVIGQDVPEHPDFPGWKLKSQAFLLKDLTAMVQSKRSSARIIYAVLLFLGMLAIFDTQVLAIFRRRKEIGTLIALGMTRFQVICLFTLEGMLLGVLALGVATVIGAPLLYLTSTKGIPLPQATDSYGFALQDRLFPVYSLSLILGVVVLIMITVTIVSFLPTRKIARLKPTEALKGKVS